MELGLFYNPSNFHHCYNGHLLQFSRETSNQYVEGIYGCRICKKFGICMEGRFCCLQCRYDLCWTCKPAEQNNLTRNCPKGHNLIFTNDRLGYMLGLYNCDLCKRSDLPVDAGRYICVQCSYDICQICRPKEPNLQGMIDINERKCDNNHNLVFTTDRRDQYLDGLYGCNICKSQLLSADAGRYACIECTYDACWNCIRPEPYLVKLFSLCPKGHKLMLDSYSNVLNDVLKCSICRNRLAPGIERWNCKICNVILCKNCKPVEVHKKILDQSISVPEKAKDEKDQCIMCCHYKINTAFVPCGHECACSDCGSKLTKKVCPLCNTNIQLILKTFRA